MTPISDYSPDPTLTPQQHRVLTLLAAGNTITQAAASLNIHRNTIGYWRRTHPAFAREQEYAQREQRNYWHEQATRLAPQAIHAIEDCLTNPASSPSLRFRAAALIIKMATDPRQKVLKNFPALPAELDALDGQILGFRKDMEAESASFVQGAETQNPAQECTNDDAETWDTAQDCTNDRPQPIRVAPKPGRNASCPCKSGLKYKRCCANKAAAAAA